MEKLWPKNKNQIKQTPKCEISTQQLSVLFWHGGVTQGLCLLWREEKWWKEKAIECCLVYIKELLLNAARLNMDGGRRRAPSSLRYLDLKLYSRKFLASLGAGEKESVSARGESRKEQYTLFSFTPSHIFCPGPNPPSLYAFIPSARQLILLYCAALAADEFQEAFIALLFKIKRCGWQQESERETQTRCCSCGLKTNWRYENASSSLSLRRRATPAPPHAWWNFIKCKQILIQAEWSARANLIETIIFLRAQLILQFAGAAE